MSMGIASMAKHGVSNFTQLNDVDIKDLNTIPDGTLLVVSEGKVKIADENVGWTGIFQTTKGKTITVKNGLITDVS